MRVGFIDYYLDEWHANNYPGWLLNASGGDIKVTCAYAMIDSPKEGGRTTKQWCEDMRIKACESIEEVIEQSDALVILAPDNAEVHEELAQLPLRSGKPTYIDKTFAPDGRTARRILAIAEEYGTPCYTASALRYAAEYQVLERNDNQAISAWGPGDLPSYAVHLLEPLMMLMNCAAGRVQYVPGKDWYQLTIEFVDGRFSSICGYMNDSPYIMNICADSGNQVVEAKSDFFAPFIMCMITFFRTGAEQVSHEETLRVMDVLGAGTRAMEVPGEWVDV